MKQNKMKFTLFTAILFSMGWMSIEGSVEDGRTPSCCLKVSDTKIPVEDIVNYSMQTAPLCPIKAVRFHTKRNKTICSDPNDSWAKKAIKSVDSRKKLTKESSKEPCTANLIPTTPTAQGRITTGGDGCSVSSCHSTKQTGHIPFHLMRSLKSRNKKRLRKIQMGN
ncbi:eotaxin-like [Carassius carassius]|uniref:eotaxin-like n=1 Tax=Carassius carassius TaxID=217509 RepID=UPI00286864EA|nr:eotaxin-like [Carassius carassius]